MDLRVSENTKSDVYERVRTLSKESLYYFATAVLGFSDMVPELHLPFCNYVQLFPWNSSIAETRRKLAWMPRGHFKSTVCSIALPLWLLIHDRNTSIALISAVEKNTKKWLRQIKHILEYNGILRKFFPELRPDYDKWDQTEILVKRDSTISGVAQASITASSITSGQASQHYSHIIMDDPVNEKVAASDVMMEAAKDLYIYLESLLKDWETSTFTLVGTPWGRGDVLEYAMEVEVAHGERLYWGIGARGGWDVSPVLRDMPELKPIYTEGEPIFPAICPESKLKFIERQDVEKYYLQYLCKPYEMGRNGFDLMLIRDYVLLDDFQIKCDCHPRHYHNLGDMSVVGMCDPAATENKKGCRSAVVIAAKARCGCRFLVEEWADHIDPGRLPEKICEITNKWSPYLRNFGIEAVAFQLTFKAWLEQLQAEGKVPLGVKFHDLKPAGREKDARIKSQQTPVMNGVWHKRPTMRYVDNRKNLLWELSRWPYAKERDVIDAGFGYCDDMWALPEAFMAWEGYEGEAIDLNDQQEQIDLPLLRAESA